MNFRAVFLCVLLIVGIVSPAQALVGDDIYKDAPDLFCPARVVSVIPIHDAAWREDDLGTDDTFAVILAADVAKTVSGTLQVLSHDQPLKVPFSNIALTASPYSVTDGKNIVRSGTTYNSAPLYFALPHSMTLTAVWIYDLKLDGKPADCGTLPLYHAHYKSLSPLKWHGGAMSDVDVRRQAPPHPPLAVAEKRIDFSGCPAVVKEAEAVSLQTPEYPRGVALRKTSVIIRIALDAAGRVADASVLQSGGTPEFDAQAFTAAVKSRYNPRLFLCASVPGFYTFRANFDPRG
ncbi:MAG: TonB family protein [Candidatus Eremiobacteraeota bacterium]|nr:TonB family protein [Candidatus Eremiobacteraeota bacterium]